MTARVSGWWADFAGALQFLTRLPRLASEDHPFDLARSGAVLPLAGALIGALAGGVYWAARACHVPGFVAATLAVATSAAITGGLHEDGLADTVDGFGGGRTRERKLEIMSDSRIGTYGVLALIFATAIKIGSLQSMPGSRGLPVLIAAHALARGAMSFVAFALPAAKATGLAAMSGRPHIATLVITAALGVAIAAATLSPIAAVSGIVAVIVVTVVLRQIAQRQIGGYTGDVLGAVEQLGELAVLLVAAVLI